MYNDTSIEELIKRIGWQQPVPPTTLVLSSENGESTSGRYFNAFNPMVTIESVAASIINKDADNDAVNELLVQLRKEGVMQVLSDVYNLNTRATAYITNNVTSVNYLTDYSGVIIAKSQYFDEAIGYSVAVKTLQLLIATIRSNRQTTSIKADYEQLMQYLEGSYTVQGQLISEGLLARYKQTIGRLIDVLFPTTIPDGSVIDENGNIRRPRLTGKHPW